MSHPVLEHYKKLTEFLGVALGPDYEAALHDLTDRSRSIIALANGHISGRQLGAPLSDEVLQFLLDKSGGQADCLLHYHGVSATGKALRCSTLFIKDKEKRLIGLLSLYFDDSRHREMSEKILSLCHPDSFLLADAPPIAPALSGAAAQTAHGADTAAAGAAVRALASLGISPSRLTAGERVKIIMALHADGVFLRKGAVKAVAQALACSPASIYRYLAQTKQSADGGAPL